MDKEQLDRLLMPDDGNEAHCLAHELFEIYEQEAWQKIEELDGACSARDGDKLRYIVHFIGGSAGNLGLVRLSGICRAVERAIDKRQFDDYGQAPEVIRAEFNLACEHFREAFGI